MLHGRLAAPTLNRCRARRIVVMMRRGSPARRAHPNQTDTTSGKGATTIDAELEAEIDLDAKIAEVFRSPLKQNRRQGQELLNEKLGLPLIETKPTACRWSNGQGETSKCMRNWMVSLHGTFGAILPRGPIITCRKAVMGWTSWLRLTRLLMSGPPQTRSSPMTWSERLNML